MIRRECKNLLYPMVLKGGKLLLDVCHTYGYQANRVYKNEVAGEPKEVIPNIAADPTLTWNKFVYCAQCNQKGAIHIRDNPRDKEGMIMFFICCNPHCGSKQRVHDPCLHR